MNSQLLIVRPSSQRVYLLCAVALLFFGCAGHSAKTLQARAALDAGTPEKAVALLNKELKVKSSAELPTKEKKDTTLLVLDRAMILQQLADYKNSSRDLQYSDKSIEILDLSRKATDEIGKYLFSDDVGPYKAPPYEKLMINTVNMMNYITIRQLSGARVEARRFSILRKYLKDNNNSAVTMGAPGSYLAGFVFEKSGKTDEALRYYDEALEHGDFKSLVGPVRYLQGIGSYSSDRLTALLQHAAASSATDNSPEATQATEGTENMTPEAGADPSGTNSTAESTAATDELAKFSIANRPTEILVILNYGRVPAKIAKRIPIGLALTLGTLYFSPSMGKQASQLAAQGLVTWINFPDLEPETRKILTPSVKLDGQYQTLEGALNVADETRAQYEEEKGKIIASAGIRMVTRAAIGQGAKAAINDPIWGLVASLGSQAALAAADTPDTRSWATLPARIAFLRIPVTPGKHQVEVQAQGQTMVIDVDLKPGGWKAVMLTVLR